MLIDSHAHLDFYEELTPVLAAASAAGVSGILAIGIGDGPATMHRALELARTHTTAELTLWATAGIHPQEAHQADAAALERLRVLAADPLCLAVGEIGLDYYHADNPEIAVQQTAFRAQMQIAAGAGKPITLHCRTSELATPQAKARYGAADAADDLLTMLEQEWAPSGLSGILHCFSGTVEQARRALGLGFYLSFAGNLTYPRSVGIREAAVMAPADRILVETDAPFLAPVPLRGQQNQPGYVVHTAAILAELRGVDPHELRRQTTTNFETLFAI